MMSVKIYLINLRKKIKKIFFTIIKKQKIKNFYFYKFLLNQILEKVIITILYIIPFLNITYSTHKNIRRVFPDLLTKILPNGDLLFKSKALLFLFFESPFIFLLYFFGSDIILSPRFGNLNISNNLKLALLITTTLELLHSVIMRYHDFLFYAIVLLGTEIRINHLIALNYVLFYIIWCFIYLYLYYTSMTEKIPKVPDLFGMKKALDSLLFIIRIQKKDNNK